MQSLTRICEVMLFGFLVLASVHLMADADTARFRSLSQKVKCDCGCGDILGECAHKECTRRPKLKQEIMDGMLYGESDEQILQQMVAAHGSAVLVTPMFRGFDTLLWIVPTVGGILVLGLVAYKFRKARPQPSAKSGT